MDALTKEDDRRPHVVPVPVAPEAVRLTTLRRLITHHGAATRQTTEVGVLTPEDYSPLRISTLETFLPVDMFYAMTELKDKRRINCAA
jgi:hypothetical protein